MVPGGRRQGPAQGAADAARQVPLPVGRHTARSGLPGVPRVPQERLRGSLRETRARDWRQSEGGHCHGSRQCYAEGEAGAPVSRRSGHDGHSQNW